MANPTTCIVRITLSPTTGHDVRVITLFDGRPVDIGRTSRSESKNLQCRVDNALFDCAVISRRHAQLRINAWALPNDQVLIKDLGSKHGTIVNGKKLESNVEHCLRSGDTIKLGGPITVGHNHDGITFKFTRLELDPQAPLPLVVEPRRDTTSTRYGFRAPSYNSFIDYEDEDEDEREDEVQDDDVDDDDDHDENAYEDSIGEDEEHDDDEEEDDNYDNANFFTNGDDHDSSVGLDDGHDDGHSTKSDKLHPFQSLERVEQQTSPSSSNVQHSTELGSVYAAQASQCPDTQWNNFYFRKLLEGLKDKSTGPPLVRPSMWPDDSMRDTIADDRQFQSPSQLDVVHDMIAGTDQVVDGASSFHPSISPDNDNVMSSTNPPKLANTDNLNLPTSSQHEDGMIDVLLKQQYDPIRKLPDVACSQVAGTNASIQDDKMIRRMIPSFEKTAPTLNYGPLKTPEMFHSCESWTKPSVAAFPTGNDYTESLKFAPAGHVFSSNSDANHNSVGEAVRETTAEGSSSETRPPLLPTPSKISIVDLVERQDSPKDQVTAAPPTPASAVVTSIESNGSKRKATELEETAIQEVMPQAPSKRQRTKAPRAPHMRSGLVKGAFIGAIGGAVGGAAGVMAFLNSSASQTLIDWLGS